MSKAGSGHGSLQKAVQGILQGTHPCLPQSRTGSVQHLYKYILFGFSRKDGSLPPDSPKQNKTGFLPAAKPIEGQGCRMLGTDSQSWYPAPTDAHSAPGRVSPATLTLLPAPPQLSLPAPAFLQPGLHLLSSPSLSPPIIPGHINHLPIENSVVTPLKRPFHIHLPTQHQKQILLPPGKWPSQH